MHDVAIVGAGPGGGMAAWQLARAGHRVVVLEKRRRVGEPVQCGESLSGFALSDNGVAVDDEWVVRRVAGIRVFGPSGHHFEVPVPGYCIRRGAFDRHLAQLASSAGAEVRTSTKVLSVARSGGGGWRLATSAGDVTARALVAADGPDSRMGASLGLGSNSRMSWAVQFRFPPREPLRDDHIQFHCGTAFPGGYAWCFDRGHEVSVGVVSTQDPRPPLDAFCRRLGLDPSSRASMTRGPIPQGGPNLRLAGEGVVTVGDAAGLANPCSAGGVHAALHSARLAAQHLTAALASDPIGPLDGYETAMRATPFCDPVLSEGRRIMDVLTDPEWDAVVYVLEGQDTRRMTPGKVVWRGLRRPSAMRALWRMRGLLPAFRIYATYGW